MATERVNPRALEALSETFKKRGWDPEVPKAVSDWGEFSFSNSTFSVEIKNPDGEVTNVDLFMIPQPKPEKEIVYVKISWGQKGSNLEVSAFPVTKIMHVDSAFERGEREEAIVIVAPWEKFAFTITKSGRVMIQ